MALLFSTLCVLVAGNDCLHHRKFLSEKRLIDFNFNDVDSMMYYISFHSFFVLNLFLLLLLALRPVLRLAAEFFAE